MFYAWLAGVIFRLVSVLLSVQMQSFFNVPRLPKGKERTLSQIWGFFLKVKFKQIATVEERTGKFGDDCFV